MVQQQPLSLKNVQKQGDQLKIRFDRLEKEFDNNLYQLKRGSSSTKIEWGDFVKQCDKFCTDCQQLLNQTDSFKEDPTVTNFSQKLADEKSRLTKFIDDASKFIESIKTGTGEEPTATAEPTSTPLARDRKTKAERGTTQSSSHTQSSQSKPSPQYDNPPEHEDSDEEDSEAEEDEDTEASPHPQKRTHAKVEEEEIPAGGSASSTTQPLKGERFQALGDLPAKEPGDLSLRKGDILHIIVTRNYRNQNPPWRDLQQPPLPFFINMKTSKRKRPEETTHSLSQSLRGKRPSSDIRHGAVSENSSTKCQLQMFLKQWELNHLAFDLPLLVHFKEKMISIRRCLSDPHLTLACHLVPRLSESNLAFHDLYWNNQADKLMKRHVRVLKCMRAVRIENVPATDEMAGLEVQSRHIRICLFDGTQVHSNIHTITAQFNKRQPKTWRFLGDKLTEKQTVAEQGDFFVRSNYARRDVVLLIEVSLTYLRTSSGERGELSCGWASLPLLLDSGVDTQREKYVHYGHETVSNKVYNLPLNGGTPFDKGVSLTTGTSTSGVNPLRSAISATKQPHLVLKVMSPSETQREHIDALPDVLIWSTVCSPFAYWFRRLAGETLIRNRTDMQSAELIPDAFLSTFPYVAQEPDLMDVVRILWNDKDNSIPKIDRKSEHMMARHFRDSYVSSGAVLYNTLVLPAYSLLNAANLKLRKETFESFVGSWRREKEPVTWLSGAIDKSVKFAPLDIFDLALNITGPHSLD